jgi:hypothetical protein
MWDVGPLHSSMINSNVWEKMFSLYKVTMNFQFETSLLWCYRLKHRGPDWSGLYQHGDCYLAHQRLAIIDPASGDQPLFNEDKSIVVTVCRPYFSNFCQSDVASVFFLLLKA